MAIRKTMKPKFTPWAEAKCSNDRSKSSSLNVKPYSSNTPSPTQVRISHFLRLQHLRPSVKGHFILYASLSKLLIDFHEINSKAL